MNIDILTLFPGYFDSPLGESLMGKAVSDGLVRIAAVDIRDFAQGKHRVTDDYPFGGGEGMVMKPEPVVAAIEHARQSNPGAEVVLLTPQGRPLDQGLASELAGLPGLVVVCGRYEGVDERVCAFVDREISVGDYILPGGEAAALALIEAVCRLVPGVVGNEDSVSRDSLPGRLKYPQYTRPREFRGMSVPEVLVSGDHQAVRRWRLEQSLRRTLERRPDLLREENLSQEEREILDRLRSSKP